MADVDLDGDLLAGVPSRANVETLASMGEDAMPACVTGVCRM